MFRLLRQLEDHRVESPRIHKVSLIGGVELKFDSLIDYPVRGCSPQSGSPKPDEVFLKKRGF